MMPKLDPANRKRIQTFKTIVADLKAGKQHSITRLTTIKSLCKAPAVAAAFTKHLASLAAETIDTRPRPRHLSTEQWQKFKGLAVLGMQALDLDLPTSELRKSLTTVRESQNAAKHIHWHDVCIIECGELLQIELALECRLQVGVPSHVAYHAARRHAEKYDSRYGTGLIPASANALEQIVSFWSES